MERGIRGRHQEDVVRAAVEGTGIQGDEVERDVRSLSGVASGVASAGARSSAFQVGSQSAAGRDRRATRHERRRRGEGGHPARGGRSGEEAIAGGDPSTRPRTGLSGATPAAAQQGRCAHVG